MVSRLNTKYSFSSVSLPNYDGVVGKALLEYRTCINEVCSKPDCNILDCLYCGNCYYRITLENGDVLANSEVDLSTIDNYSKGFEDNDHEILFYDHVPEVDNLFSYLFDDNSQFRIVRTEDRTVMYDHTGTNKKLVKGKR